MRNARIIKGTTMTYGDGNRSLIIAAALSMALAVAAGAFGAHGAADARSAGWLATGSLYQMVHGVAALVLAARHPRIAMLLLAGAAIFAVTLYAMALGAPRWLGAVTPIGGAIMIGGWLALAGVTARRL
jgi:uncharacterized membrane protein YgdD (TMEM256/DUF423 family)